MVYPVAPVTVMAPAVRNIAEVQAWLDHAYRHILSENKRLNAITAQMRLVQADAIADLSLATITDPADTPLDADALRDDLVANTIPSIEARLSSIQTSHNAILAALRAILVVEE